MECGKHNSVCKLDFFSLTFLESWNSIILEFQLVGTELLTMLMPINVGEL